MAPLPPTVPDTTETCENCQEPGAQMSVHELSKTDDYAQWLCADCRKMLDFIILP